MRIRPMTAGDVERVAVLCGQLGYPSTASEVAARFNALVLNQEHGMFVAEEESEGGPRTEAGTGPVLGWVHVQQQLPLEAGPFADLGGLVVDQAGHGRGIGRLLVEAAERWAIARGYDEMRVRSNVIRSAAHEFYRRLGYEVIKTQLNFRKPLSPTP